MFMSDEWDENFKSVINRFGLFESWWIISVLRIRIIVLLNYDIEAFYESNKRLKRWKSQFDIYLFFRAYTKVIHSNF